MQASLDFLSPDLSCWYGRLAFLLGEVGLPPRRAPLDQLVKSIISARTLDAVSAAAFRRLKTGFPTPQKLTAATPAEIKALIADVTFADAKARWVADSLAMILAKRGDVSLDFLESLPLDDALGWLEQLPGVGRKVAASTLNASTFSRPVMIVDTHVQRVLTRLGIVRPGASIRMVSEAVTGAMVAWDGLTFLEFHVMVKRLGQRFCRPERPSCGACPLARECPSAARRRMPMDRAKSFVTLSERPSLS